MNSRAVVAILLFMSFSISCGRNEPKEPDVRTFTVKGEVAAIDPARETVTIAHEEIQGFMMAMTMPFKVRDRSLLAGVDVGDSVVGTLNVSKTESWIGTLKVIRKSLNPEGVHRTSQP